MIKVYCPNCGAGLKTKDDSRGKCFRCPKCRQPVHVPDPEPALAELSESLEPEPQPAPPPAHVQQTVNVTVGDVSNRTGYPCKRCSSTNLYAVKKTKTAGYICFVIGLFTGPFTCGAGTILCIVAFFLNQKETRCKDCSAKWFDPASPIPARLNYVKLGVALFAIAVTLSITASIAWSVGQGTQALEEARRRAHESMEQPSTAYLGWKTDDENLENLNLTDATPSQIESVVARLKKDGFLERAVLTKSRKHVNLYVKKSDFQRLSLVDRNKICLSVLLSFESSGAGDVRVRDSAEKETFAAYSREDGFVEK